MTFNIKDYEVSNEMTLPKNTLINLTRDELLAAIVSLKENNVYDLHCKNKTVSQGNYDAKLSGLEFTQIMRENGYANYVGSPYWWVFVGRNVDYTNGSSDITTWNMAKAYQFFHGSLPDLGIGMFMEQEPLKNITHLFEPMSSTGDFAYFAQVCSNPDLDVTIMDIEADAMKYAKEFPWTKQPNLIQGNVLSYDPSSLNLPYDRTVSFVGKNSHCGFSPKDALQFFKLLSQTSKFVAIECVMFPNLHSGMDSSSEDCTDPHLVDTGIRFTTQTGSENLYTRTRNLFTEISQQAQGDGYKL